MKKFVAYGLTALCLFLIPAAALSAAPVSVEILYMNHGPMQPTLRELRKLCDGYGKSLTVAWYDSESPEGEKFMVKKGVRGHVPLIIWIAGKPKISVNGKEIQFIGFPTGSGPAFFQGKWTTADLRGALDLATGKK
jgi:hypothetical protein